jgi:uncharacterized membrane protein
MYFKHFIKKKQGGWTWYHSYINTVLGEIILFIVIVFIYLLLKSIRPKAYLYLLCKRTKQ